MTEQRSPEARLLELRKHAAKAAAREEAAREARESLIKYIWFTMPHPADPDDVSQSRYTITPQARLLCQIMEKIARGEPLTERGDKNAAISIGPQTGKSEILSRRAPAWMFGRNPQLNAILGSYNQDFANEFGDDVGNIIKSDQHRQVFPAHQLRKGGQAKDLLISTDGGKLAFVGVGGSGTGKPADVFIVDDPIRNDDDAQSEVYRERTWNWFTKVASTRIHNESAMVVVHCMTGDTPVTMADGTRKPLADVRVGDEVLAWESGWFRPRKVLNWASQGEDDVFEIRTGNNCVRANARHPFLVQRGSRTEWVKVADLREGDQLVCSGVERGHADQRMTEDQAWLLGFMFGDGWLTRRDTTTYDKVRQKHYPRRGFVTCYAEGVYQYLNNKVVALFERLFGVVPKRTQFGYRRTEVQAVGKWFSENGLNGSAKTKRLPPWLFSQPLSIRRAFLEGFVAADGALTKAHAYRRVGLANAQLVADLRHLARSAGLRPTNINVGRQIVRPPNAKAPIESEMYRVGWSANVRNDATYPLAIRSIKPAGRAVVYDIQVEGAESFIADGLVSHNTRWHEDDLIGRLADPDHPERNKKYAGIAEDWIHINIPAVVEDPTLAKALGLTLRVQQDDLVRSQFGIKPIAALWPERFSLPFLAKQKRLDKRGFTALRMGKPAPEDGEFFTAADLVEYHSPAELPERLRNYGASDHAVSEKQKADATVLGCVGIDEHDDIWVRPDLIWERMETDRTVEELLHQFKTHQPLLWWMESELISKSFGPFLHKRMQEERIYTAIDAVVPSKDKRTRARSIQGRMRMRKVHFPAFAPWWPDARNQLLKFPYGTNDDFVDFLSHIGMGLTKEVSAPSAAPAGNVIQVGSMKWILAQTKKRESKEKLDKAIAGF